LGEETDSYDSDGKLLRRRDPSHLTGHQVREAILAHQGDLVQRPPAFSAIKLRGVPAYRPARQGLPVDLPSREVRVWDLCIESLELPDAVFSLSCGAGTYVRSIAHDIGQSLGTGAVVTALRRIASGADFRLDRATTLEQIEASAQLEKLDFVLDPALLLTDHLSYPVDEGEEHRIKLGQVLTLRPEAGTLPAGAKMKAVRACGTLVAIGELIESNGRMGFRPAKVLT
jgi:tRNA pseudouridine55 synthase